MDKGYLSIFDVSEYWYCKRSSFYSLLRFLSLEENNFFIIDGRLQSIKQDINNFSYNRNGLKEYFNYTLICNKLGLIGKADTISFLEDKIKITEIKRGYLREQPQHHWQVRLLMYTAKEMWQNKNIEGSIYYSKSRRHILVEYNKEIEDEINFVVSEIKEKLKKRLIKLFPKANDARCMGCMFELICG